MTSFCVFDVGERRVGLPMAHVREIIEHTVISTVPVPLAPEFVRGLFNLRGQVLPYVDLGPFVGAIRTKTRPSDRALVIERGDFRFAMDAKRIDTLEVDTETFQPLKDAVLFPALDAEAAHERGNFQVIHLDRLEACLSQAMKFNELADAAAPM
jgi:purine-binding chemotaxis protein CheW